MKIQMPACECGERAFRVDHTDLIDALGQIDCEICGTPLFPVDPNGAAVEIALDIMKARAILVRKPSAWFAELSGERDAILRAWAAARGDA